MRLPLVISFLIQPYSVKLILTLMQRMRRGLFVCLFVTRRILETASFWHSKQASMPSKLCVIHLISSVKLFSSRKRKLHLAILPTLALYCTAQYTAGWRVIIASTSYREPDEKKYVSIVESYCKWRHWWLPQDTQTHLQVAATSHCLSPQAKILALQDIANTYTE